MRETKVVAIYFALITVITLVLIILFYQLSLISLEKVSAQTEDEDILGIAQVNARVLIDEDGDGMPNNWEAIYGLNPSDPLDANYDPDGDGLLNLEEYLHGTNPLDPDTDDGGSNDGYEVHNSCTNPLNPLDDYNFECPICGDGILVPSEECDDSNTNSNDGCSSTCLIEYCGDGIKNNINEECDLTDGLGAHQQCSLTCFIINLSYCGDGLVEDPNDEGYSEECEGGQIQNASCVSSLGYAGVYSKPCNGSLCHWSSYGTCVTSEYCSDGIKNGDEECDDSNLSNGDGCGNTCKKEPVCGDNIKEGSEECDDGNLNNGDNCNSLCRNEIICKDNEIEVGEECDDGNNNNEDSCTNECKFNSICGNNRKERGEECDDGNVVNGDRCSSECKKESDLVDSDGDGMPNDYETRFGLDNNKNDADDDPDRDGLKNIDEYRYYTNPKDPDTDKDGLKDGDEVYIYKTNPILYDSDNDLLNDFEEVINYKTNPRDFDTDDGGIGDGDEIANKTDPLNPDDDLRFNKVIFLKGAESIKIEKINNVYHLLQEKTFILKLDSKVDFNEVNFILDNHKYKFAKKDGFYVLDIPISEEVGMKLAKIEFKFNNISIVSSFKLLVEPFGNITKSNGDDIRGSKIILYKKNNKGKWKLYKDFGYQFNNPTKSDNGNYGFVVEKGIYKLKVSKVGFRSKTLDNLSLENGEIINKHIKLEEINKAVIALLKINNTGEQVREFLIVLFFILLVMLLLIIRRIYLLIYKAKIIGYIYNYDTLTPIIGVEVYLNSKDRKSITNEEGRFEFDMINILGSEVLFIDRSDLIIVKENIRNFPHRSKLYFMGEKIKSFKPETRVISYFIKK